MDSRETKTRTNRLSTRTRSRSPRATRTRFRNIPDQGSNFLPTSNSGQHVKQSSISGGNDKNTMSPKKEEEEGEEEEIQTQKISAEQRYERKCTPTRDDYSDISDGDISECTPPTTKRPSLAEIGERLRKQAQYMKPIDKLFSQQINKIFEQCDTFNNGQMSAFRMIGICKAKARRIYKDWGDYGTKYTYANDVYVELLDDMEDQIQHGDCAECKEMIDVIGKPFTDEDSYKSDEVYSKMMDKLLEHHEETKEVCRKCRLLVMENERQRKEVEHTELDEDPIVENWSPINKVLNFQENAQESS